MWALLVWSCGLPLWSRLPWLGLKENEEEEKNLGTLRIKRILGELFFLIWLLSMHFKCEMTYDPFSHLGTPCGVTD